MRVLKLSTLFPGPLAGRTLLQLGFEVVKVEPPAGDPIRQVLPTLYKVLNEGKEIIYYSIKNGTKKVRRLAEEVDAVLTTLGHLRRRDTAYPTEGWQRRNLTLSMSPLWGTEAKSTPGTTPLTTSTLPPWQEP
jgi:hypothetical protein